MKSFLLHCLFAAAGSSACLAATYPLASQQNRAGAVNDPGTVLLSTGDGSGFAAIDDTFSGQVVVTATIQFDTFGGANAHAGLELADGANPRLALGNGGIAPVPAAGEFVSTGASIGVVLLLPFAGLWLHARLKRRDQ